MIPAFAQALHRDVGDLVDFASIYGDVIEVVVADPAQFPNHGVPPPFILKPVDGSVETDQ